MEWVLVLSLPVSGNAAQNYAKSITLHAGALETGYQLDNHPHPIPKTVKLRP